MRDAIALALDAQETIDVRLHAGREVVPCFLRDDVVERLQPAGAHEGRRAVVGIAEQIDRAAARRERGAVLGQHVVAADRAALQRDGEPGVFLELGQDLAQDIVYELLNRQHNLGLGAHHVRGEDALRGELAAQRRARQCCTRSLQERPARQTFLDLTHFLFLLM